MLKLQVKPLLAQYPTANGGVHIKHITALLCRFLTANRGTSEDL